MVDAGHNFALCIYPDGVPVGALEGRPFGVPDRTHGGLALFRVRRYHKLVSASRAFWHVHNASGEFL